MSTIPQNAIRIILAQSFTLRILIRSNNSICHGNLAENATPSLRAESRKGREALSVLPSRNIHRLVPATARPVDFHPVHAVFGILAGMATDETLLCANPIRDVHIVLGNEPLRTVDLLVIVELAVETRRLRRLERNLPAMA